MKILVHITLFKIKCLAALNVLKIGSHKHEIIKEGTNGIFLNIRMEELGGICDLSVHPFLEAVFNDTT